MAQDKGLLGIFLFPKAARVTDSCEGDELSLSLAPKLCWSGHLPSLAEYRLYPCSQGTTPHGEHKSGMGLSGHQPLLLRKPIYSWQAQEKY